MNQTKPNLKFCYKKSYISYYNIYIFIPRVNLKIIFLDY